MRRAFILPSLLALLGGCPIVLEGADAGTGDGLDAGHHPNVQHWDGGSLRPPEPDASVGGPDGSTGFHPVDGGGSSSSSGGSSSGSSSSGGFPLDGGGGGDAGSSGGISSCAQWQDCPPHYGDLNSAYECISNACVCDPTGHWATDCTNMGGYFSAFDCLCVQGGSTPPSADPNPTDNCGWEWEYYCEPDRWVDTSHYERQCETVNGQTECHDVWVESGRWESGGCNHTRWAWKCH